MRILQNEILVVFLFCLIAAFLERDNNIDGDHSTDLFHFGPVAYGLSKNENGNAPEIWQKSFRINPGEIGTDDDFLEQNNLGRQGIIDENKRWFNATVPYVILGPYTSKEEEMLQLAMLTIQYYTCIRFVPHNGQRDYIVIRHIMRGGCKSSGIGRVGGRQRIVLEAPHCFYKIGKVIHELLHVLGMVHEHSSTDRDNYITVNTNNIQPGKEWNFNKYTDVKTSNFGIPYDYNSVMHYTPTAFTHNGQKTIEAKIPDTRHSSRMGQRFGLSVRDALKISIMYHCYYEINKTETFSRVLPNISVRNGSKVELWNTYFRNFVYNSASP